MTETEPSAIAPGVMDSIKQRAKRLTLTEGRYQQVRRMFAAVGNHVEALHRVSIGGLTLGGLAPCAWCALYAPDITMLFAACGAD